MIIDLIWETFILWIHVSSEYKGGTTVFLPSDMCQLVCNL